MANRRPQGGGRRMDFGHNHNDRGKNFGRSGVSPWQGGAPSGGLPNLLPLSGVPTEATLALASNIINLLQPRQNPVPSLLDMPIRRDFAPDMGRYDRGYGHNRMGNQGNFRRTGNYNNRTGDRMINNRKPFRPNDSRHHYKNSPKREADSKAKPVKESEEKDTEKTEGKDDKEEVKKEAPKTRYDDIDSQLLRCHICHKSMWDGRSFENHLSGRAHAIMMQKTAESYALTADTMRQEYKIREMKRTRKAGQQPARDFYCAMCDMYAADGAAHRTTVGHRKLKKYLHPTCTCCHKEMPTRIELDEHRLSAEHLRNIHDKNELVTKPKPEVMVISTLTMEQSYLREDRERRRPPGAPATPAPAPAAPAGADAADAADGEEDKTEVKKEPVEGEEVEVKTEKMDPLDNEKTILDFKEGDDISNVTPDMLPAYSTERGVGESFLTPFHCVQCKLCRKLLDGPATAAVHLRTWRHHQLFTRLLAARDKDPAGEAAAPAPAAGKRAAAGGEQSGNWKRRRTSDDDADEREAAADQDEPAPRAAQGNQNDQDEQDDQDDAVNEESGGEAAEEGAALDMPPDDALEDWDQPGDDAPADEQDQEEKNNDAGEEEEQEEEEEEKVPEKEKTPPVAKLVAAAAAPPVRASPRATRGRRRC